MRFTLPCFSVVLLAFTLLPFFIFSQDLGKYEIRSITDEDGLPTNETYNIVQDQDGYIWISNELGVSKYDGKEFVLFDRSSGIRSTSVYRILLEQDTSIVGVGARGDLFKIKNDTVRDIVQADSIQMHLGNRSFPYSYYKGKKGLHHVGTRKGYFCFDSEGNLIQSDTATHSEYTRIPVRDDDYGFPFCYAVPKTNQNGELWVGIEPKSNTESTLENAVQLSSRPASIYPTKGEGYVFLPIENHLFFWKEGQEKVKTLKLNQTILSVFYLNGKLFITTRKEGVLCYRFEEEEFFFEYQILNGLSVSSMIQTSNGQFWFSTLEDGLKIIDPHVPIVAYKSTGNITRFLPGKPGLLVGFERGDFDQNDGEGRQTLLGGKKIVNVIYWNERFIINNGSTFSIDSNGIINDFKLPYENEDFNNALQLHTPNDSVLIWSNTKGLSFWNKTDETITHVYQDIGYEFVTPVISYKDDYVTTFPRHIYFFEKNNPENVRKIQVGRPTLCFFTINNQLIGFDIAGNLFEVKNDKISFFSIPEINGLNRVLDAKFDNNTLHFSTRKGVYSWGFDFENNKLLLLNYDNVASASQVEIYGDTLFFSTRKNIYKKYMGDAGVNNPEMHFGSVSVNNEILPLKETYELEHEENNIEIQMRSITLASPILHYKYQLIGQDDRFHYSEDGSINYSSLDPGTYELQVAVTSNGLTYSPTQTIRFIIASPFWQKWWFILSALAVIFVLGNRIWMYRIRRIKKDAEMESTITNLRSLALAGQLNPHLIFNVLNSIQGKVSEGEEEAANIYIAQFSKYLRNALNLLQVTSIPIEEELRMIQLYFNLEKIRFEDKVTLNISKDITLKGTPVPPLVLQPLIENAIKYGNHSGDVAGMIAIRLTEDDSYLFITVSDNGIGFDTDKHFGDGLRITRERLQVLSPENNIEVIQHKDPTRIQLKIKK